MFLVKCGCGCFFTLKSTYRRPIVKCPNCEAAIGIETHAETSSSVSCIPDNAKVSVNFDI